MSRAWELVAVVLALVVVAHMAVIYVAPALPYLAAVVVLLVIARWALFPPSRW